MLDARTRELTNGIGRGTRAPHRNNADARATDALSELGSRGTLYGRAYAWCERERAFHVVNENATHGIPRRHRVALRWGDRTRQPKRDMRVSTIAFAKNPTVRALAR